jgi:hypothetical protein
MGDIPELVLPNIKSSVTGVKVVHWGNAAPGTRDSDGTMFAALERRAMTDSDRLSRFLRTKLRGAGRQYGEARQAYRAARDRRRLNLPTDERGRARIVCRRHAERRAVRLDGDDRPHCFEAGHPDCEGCVEDIRERRIETW